MYGYVAPNAFAARLKTQPAVRNIRRLRIDVTLETQEAAFPAKLQIPAHASMGGMARGATFNLHCSVLVDEGTALLRVTADASFPVGFLQHWLVPGSVRVVAVRAFHLALRNPMMGREQELRLHGRVARIAQLRL